MNRRQVRLVFLLSLLIFFGAGIIVITYTAKILKDDDHLYEATEIHENLQELIFNYTSAIQNHNNYFLSIKNEFFDEYGKNRVLSYNALRKISKSTSKNYINKDQTDSLQLHINAMYSLLDRILMNRNNDLSALYSEILFAKAKKHFNTLDEMCNEMLLALEINIHEIRQRTESKAFSIIAIVVTGHIIGMILLIVAFFYLNQEFKKTRIKEKDIREKALELTNLNKTKDTFFSIIAHDLKGPFNSLINLFDLLNVAIKEKDMSVIEENIYAIEFSARRTYNLLQNLLEWSKLQSGKIKRHPEFFEINHVVQENIDLFKEGARQKQISLISDIKGLMVYADRNMVNTVVRNLIQNALKFTNTGYIKISSKKLPEFVNICIEDSGIGMKEDDVKKLFKIDQDTKFIGNSTEKGSGLGLILCKNFVEQNNGEIWAESILNKGTNMFFSLPYKK